MLAATPSSANLGRSASSTSWACSRVPAAPVRAKASSTVCTARFPMACTAGRSPAVRARVINDSSSSGGIESTPLPRGPTAPW